MMIKLLPIIPAVYCPWTNQHHSVAACHQLCDYSGLTDRRTMYCKYNLEFLTMFTTVMCPCINRLMDVGSCADQCEFYEGDGKDEIVMGCRYQDGV